MAHDNGRKLVFHLTGAFAGFERTMIRPRIKAGLKRAIAQGVKLGRPKIDSATERKVRKQLAKGVGILKVARSLGIGIGTVQRISKERAMSLRGGAMTSPGSWSHRDAHSGHAFGRSPSAARPRVG
jgi:DNA invertase Pin-like site-specific DNA recombinase